MYLENCLELFVIVYVMLDGYCNRILVIIELMDFFGVKGNELMYNLMLCFG